MGCIGMSLDDFERCTPSEFYAAWKQWHEQMERMERSSWERTRTLALVYVQPYHLGYWLTFLVTVAITLPIAWLLQRLIGLLTARL